MLGNISIGKKIGFGFGTCILVLAGLAAITWTGLNTAQVGFTQYREIARDNVLMGRLQANMLEARLQVKNFIQTGNPKSIDAFHNRMSAVHNFVEEAKSSIRNPKRAESVKEIAKLKDSYEDAFQRIIDYQALRVKINSEVMNPEGKQSREYLSELISVASRVNNSEAAILAGKLQETFLLARLHYVKFLDTNSDADTQRVRKEKTNIDKLLQALQENLDSGEQRELIAKFKDGLNTYMAGFEKVVATIQKRNFEISEHLDTIGPRIAERAEEVKLSIKDEQDKIGPQVKSDNERTSTTMLVSSLVSILFAIGFAIIIARSISKPLSEITTIAKELALGNVEQEIGIQQKDEIGQLANAFSDMIDSQKSKAAVAKKIADGDLSMEVDIASESDTLGRSMATMKTKITELANDTHSLVQAAVTGHLGERANASAHRGEFKNIVEGINNMMEAVVGPLNNASMYMVRLSKGDIPEKISETYQGDFNEIKDAVNRCIDALNSLQKDLSSTIDAQKQGDLTAQCDSSKLEGAYAELAQGINDALAAVIAPTNDAIRLLGRYADGDLSERMRELPGKQIILTEAMNQIKDNVGALVDDVNKLATSAVEGKLAVRADEGIYNGDFKSIVSGVNNTLDAIVQPIDEAASVLDAMANYDLRARMTGNYTGDFAKIKNSLNSTGDVLHAAIGQVRTAVGQVNSAAQQISISSQQVAEGASEQASSLEETTSSMEEMSGMTKQNAENTQQAKALAESTKHSANKGTVEMDRMVSSMGEIKTSAEGTAEIIKDINEIAFQTNLLALNAAVEAARAGDAGRGFAVVAEEVRNLAGRAKDAAQNTETLIKQSVNLAETGEKISGEVNDNLKEMAKSVEKVADIIAEITVASSEQSKGIEQVNRAMVEMDQVTQRSAANSEESSSAAEELAGQADELLSMVERFRLNTVGRKSDTPIRPTSPPVNDFCASSKNTKKTTGAPMEILPLEDDPDFKEF